LGQLHEIESEIEAAGFQLLAIAPDKVEGMRATKAKHGLRARFLSDAEMKACQAFRVAYEVDAATLSDLAAHGVDLVAADAPGIQ
jgi:peroxiredoxin